MAGRRISDPEEPPAVLWWRRAALGLAGLAAALLVALLIVVVAGHDSSDDDTRAGATAPVGTPTRPASGTPTSAPATTTTPAATTPTTTATTAPPGTCAPADLALTVTTSAKAYASTGSVHLTARLTAKGAGCTAAGPLVVTVSSGAARVWGSADCTPARTAARTPLAAHGSATASRTWTRDLTAPRCSTRTRDDTAEAGTYRAVATWAGVTSEPYSFRIG